MKREKLTTDEIIERIDNKKEFEPDELYDIMAEYYVEEIEGNSSRWTQDIETIVEIEGKFYKIEWETQTLKEVKLIEKQITVKQWVSVE